MAVKKNISLIFLLLLFMVSCGNKQSETFDDQVSLVGSDVLSFIAFYGIMR